MRESIFISAEASAVWALVADPVRQGEWNEKIVAVDREPEGPVTPGERFWMIYKMSQREHESRIVVLECEASTRVTFEHRTQWNGRELIALETYIIEPRGSGVRLTQILDLSRALPSPVRVLGWLFQKFGTPTGKTSMQRVKELAEAPPPAAAEDRPRAS
jgi:hypothetical protein